MNGNPATPEEIKKIIGLARRGLNMQEIANRVGRTRRSVEVVICRHREEIYKAHGWHRLICTPRFGAPNND